MFQSMALVLVALLKSDVFIWSALAPVGILAVARARPGRATEISELKTEVSRLIMISSFEDSHKITRH